MNQPRRRSTVKTVLLIVVIVAIVCCGGGIAGFYYLLSGTTKAPKAATSAFLDELEAGDYTAAFDRLCASTKRSFEPPSFENAVKRRAPRSHSMGWGGSYSNDNGLETASITADITYADGTSGGHAFQLRKEEGAWKVCGDPY